MVITNIKLNSYRSEPAVKNGNFQTGSSVKDSKVVNFFELLYSYPAKYKIKWNSLDRLKEDLFLPSKYDALKQNSSFINDVDEQSLFDHEGEMQSDSLYNLSDLREGFLDKRYSSNFYHKKTKDIQNALSSVPIYVVLNGLNEIVLNKPRNLENSQAANKYFKKAIYDYCGAFDSSLEKRQQVGFFFINRSDAETYLQEIAKSDMNGTETVGLSIHCISLSSAYNVTREHHPGIDFRIIPDLQEVKDLLTQHLTKSSIIVEDQQQQLSFQRRSVNIFPFLGQLGRLLSPSSSFIQRDEYFKGVPIYIVQTLEQQKNGFVTQYLNTLGIIDTTYGSLTKVLNSLLGRGHNSIIQGSIKDAGCSEKYTNYVFFDETSATKFVKNNQKNVAHYPGSRIPNMETLVKKPKIFLYNLEDFVESWEEKIQFETSSLEKSVIQTIFNAKTTFFIPPEQNYKETQVFFESKNSNSGVRFTQQLAQQVNVKFRVFKNFAGILFSVGY